MASFGPTCQKSDKTRKNPYFQLSKCKILWCGARSGQNSIMINYGSKRKIQPLCLKNGGVWANLSKTRKNPGRIHTSSCRNIKSFGVVQGWVHMQFWLTVARNGKFINFVKNRRFMKLKWVQSFSRLINGFNGF